eukprot:2650051-Pleurochrysis_carterae.AAC.1
MESKYSRTAQAHLAELEEKRQVRMLEAGLDKGAVRKAGSKGGGGVVGANLPTPMSASVRAAAKEAQELGEVRARSCLFTLRSCSFMNY